jgi:hypothetical protein
VTVFDRAFCGSCTQPIIWCSTVKGRLMPVDFDPHPDGNILLHERTRLGPLAEVVAVGQDGLLPGEALRHSHFVTCPQADQHRRPR